MHYRILGVHEVHLQGIGLHQNTLPILPAVATILSSLPDGLKLTITWRQMAGPVMSGIGRVGRVGTDRRSPAHIGSARRLSAH